MLWQQDNDRAANETMAHNVRASVTLNVLNRGMKIMMIMDAMKILMTKIMMKMINVYKAEEDRKKKIMMMTTMTMMMIMDNKEIMATSRNVGNNRAVAPDRDLAV